MSKIKLFSKKNYIYFFLIISFWIFSSYLLFINANKLIFLTAFTRGEEVSLKVKFEHIYLQNSNNEKIYAIKTSNVESDKIILFLHGNTGNISYFVNQVANKYNIFAPLYPGYYLSQGEPSEQGIYENIDISINYLKGLGYEENDIIVFGTSLGSAGALYAGANYKLLNKIIIVGAFDSMASICMDKYFVFCLFAPFILDNNKLAKLVTAPVRQFHSLNDEVITFDKGENLFSNIKTKDKTFSIIKGGHNDFKPLELLE